MDAALFVPQQKGVVCERLDLQEIIKLRQLHKLRLRQSPKHRLIELSRLAGRADQKPLPVLI